MKKRLPMEKDGINHIEKVTSDYGWRKWSNSQARRIVTELSGSPLCGLQACCCFILSCWSAPCWLSCRFLDRSRKIPTPFPFMVESVSPRLLWVAYIFPFIESLKERKWREIVWRAHLQDQNRIMSSESNIYMKDKNRMTLYKDKQRTQWWFNLIMKLVIVFLLNIM